MNVKVLENKFDELDKKYTRLNDYFDPSARSKRQHRFIKDLRREYKEDCRIYSLDKYVNIYLSSSSMSQPPKVLSNISTNDRKSSYKIPAPKPKRKEISIDHMKQIKKSSKYQGAFSYTIVPNSVRNYNNASISLDKGCFDKSQDFYDEEKVEFVGNHLDLGAKKHSEDISFSYIRQSYLELNKFSSGGDDSGLSPRFLETTRKKNIEKLPDTVIKYQTDPNIEIKADKGLYDIAITDITELINKHYTNMHSENGYIQFKTGKQYNLSADFPLIPAHIFKITLKTNKNTISYYISFNKYSYETEKKTLRAIKTFKYLQESKGISQVQLPKVLEVGSTEKKKIINPLTEALYRYQNNNNYFHPDFYRNKLNSLQKDDFINKRYSKRFNKYSYDHTNGNNI